MYRLNTAEIHAVAGVKDMEYKVRRLTPTECARLQGFPDLWGHPNKISSMSDDDAEFWENVRRTYAEINGKTYKPCKTRDQLIKWYNGLHKDGAEYKMWGNGIALPCAYHILSGIAEVNNGDNGSHSSDHDKE